MKMGNIGKQIATGVEAKTDRGGSGGNSCDEHVVAAASPHQRLEQVVLRDETDSNNQLVQVREWLLHGKDTQLSLDGNLFSIECPLTGSGKVFVKRAPLPAARKTTDTRADMTVLTRQGGGFEVILHNTGPADIESWHIIDYRGGITGRTRALHRWQQSLRPPTDAHGIPRFLSNSWGDRNRDARICHEFIVREIDCGARLGVEVVQIDDGWQKGRSANSAEAKEHNGVWSGFWEADPDFWTPDPGRFPGGFAPLLEHARRKGVEIGLWYAPDSLDHFANWRRDADQILKLSRDTGVKFFKLDSIVADSVPSRRHLRSLLEAIAKESGGRIVCDIDITAGVRPGYFGEMAAGPLYLENRYTDWHNYWPHFTLRNLWQLSRWIDPRRLRIELLNNSRNAGKYEGDPLAPALYPPSTLFAGAMFANPLGWFENSSLPETYISDVAPLVKTWKEHRQEIFAGDILPVGEAPDGVSWTGFVSCQEAGSFAYALLFNERNPAPEYACLLPAPFRKAEILGGQGCAGIEGRLLKVQISRPFGYCLVRLS